MRIQLKVSDFFKNNVLSPPPQTWRNQSLLQADAINAPSPKLDQRSFALLRRRRRPNSKRPNDEQSIGTKHIVTSTKSIWH